MNYYEEQGDIRLISDIIDELVNNGVFNNVTTGHKNDWLPEEWFKPDVIGVSKYYQRLFKHDSFKKFGQFDKQLAQRPLIAIRPKRLGGDILAIDGQHTVGFARYAGDIDEMPCVVLRHPENRTLEDCIKIEATLFFTINTNPQSPSAIDKYRAGLCFGDPEAQNFDDALDNAGLHIEGLGRIDGDEFASKGAARFIKCVKQYFKVHKGEITDAVNFIRRTWGAKALKDGIEFKYRDDLIHGITTLLVFLKLGRDKEGKRLNGKAKKLKLWMENEMPKKKIAHYIRGTAGGNTQYKIVHNIIAEYNSTSDGCTISHQFLHENGIWDEQFIGKQKGIVGGYEKSFYESILDESRDQKVTKKVRGQYRTASFPNYD